MLDYAFYTDEFLGEIFETERDFKLGVRRAEIILKEHINRKMEDEYKDSLDYKYCLCTLAEMELYNQNLVSSESNDGFSVSYVTKGTDSKSVGDEYYRIIHRYIDPKYTYLGLLTDEEIEAEDLEN